MCYALREILIESYNRALILIETFIDPPTTDVNHEIAEIHNGLLNLCKLMKLMCLLDEIIFTNCMKKIFEPLIFKIVARPGDWIKSVIT